MVFQKAFDSIWHEGLLYKFGVMCVGGIERGTSGLQSHTIHINELANTLENSAAPGLIQQDSEIKCFKLYADDLVLLLTANEQICSTA